MATLAYTAIRVKDIEESIQFYTQVLGMKLVMRQVVPATKGEMAIVKSERAEHLLELNSYSEAPPYSNGEDLDHIAFRVEDLDVALRELAAKHITRVYEIIDWPRSRWTYIKDPNGIWIELYERKGA